MTTSVLQSQHFEGGVPVDQQAEAELARWADRRPRQDCEDIQVASVALAAPTCDPDPYDVRREQQEKRAIDEERREGLWQ